MNDGFLVVSSYIPSKEDAIRDLMRIRGIGKELAEKYYESGIRSIKDVIESGIVKESIRMYAKYIDDIEKKIPLKTVEAFANWLDVYLMTDNSINVLEVIPVGSYRRNIVSTHDIDFLVIRGESSNVIEKIEELLKKRKEYIATLEKGEHQYDFIMKIKNIARVIEIYTAPVVERGSALIHTTGPKEFGIALRMLARSRNLKFNQHGLFDRSSRIVIARETEKDIFKALGLKYISPDMRGDEDVIKNIYEMVHKKLKGGLQKE